MITVADYSNGSEGYMYNYYVSIHMLHYCTFGFRSDSYISSLLLTVIAGRCHSKKSCGDRGGIEKRREATGKNTEFRAHFCNWI